jgi:hypothetical protein
MGWRDFWPFGRKAEPQAPARAAPIDCRANGNWARGDLALCMIDSWKPHPGAPLPIKGRIYRVLQVVEDIKPAAFETGEGLLAYWLALEGMDGWSYQSNTFRKVVPDHSACEAEFREFLLGCAPLPKRETAA